MQYLWKDFIIIYFVSVRLARSLLCLAGKVTLDKPLKDFLCNSFKPTESTLCNALEEALKSVSDPLLL